MRRLVQNITRSLAMGCLLGGSVLAQRTTVTPVPPPPPANTPSEVSTAAKDAVQLSPQEMLAQAKQDGDQTKASLAKLEQMQQTARDQNDIIKLNCLSDLVVQVKAAMNIGDTAMTDLQDAIARRDDGARTHAFTKHNIVTQKVDLLAGEAGSCVGQDVAFVGETQVTVQKDPRMAGQDPTRVPLPRFVVDRAPEASPFI